MRERVVAARRLQTDRFAADAISCNAAMDARLTRRSIQLAADASKHVNRLERLSGRGQDRVLRLARTIADLAGEDEVSLDHLDEATGYRLSDPMQAAA